MLRESGRGKLIRVFRRQVWLTRHDGNLPFIIVMPVKHRTLEERLNVRMKKKVNLLPEIVCVWVVRRNLKHIASIRCNTEGVWFGSVGIVAGLPTMFVMELCISAHPVMIGIANECDNGKKKWDRTQLPRLLLPTRTHPLSRRRVMSVSQITWSDVSFEWPCICLRAGFLLC
jgi:hypothetical protein